MGGREKIQEKVQKGQRRTGEAREAWGRPWVRAGGGRRMWWCGRRISGRAKIGVAGVVGLPSAALQRSEAKGRIPGLPTSPLTQLKEPSTDRESKSAGDWRRCSHLTRLGFSGGGSSNSPRAIDSRAVRAGSGEEGSRPPGRAFSLSARECRQLVPNTAIAAAGWHALPATALGRRVGPRGAPWETVGGDGGSG